MKIKLISIFIGMILFQISDFSLADIPFGYKVKNDFFIISTKTPPALIYVTDSIGRICGVNPSAKLDAYGILLNQSMLVNKIPLSQAEQQNNGDPDNGFAPMPATPWMITILDGGNQTYTINLKGITSGTQTITVKDLPLGKPANPHGTKFSVLIQPNITSQVQVSVDSTSHTVGITPVVGNDGLLNDIQSACAQNLIVHRECDFLEDKAERIQKNLDNKKFHQAGELLRSFLCNLGDRHGDGDDNRDCHESVQQPALGIIIADVKALLAQIGQEEKRHYGDDDDRH